MKKYFILPALPLLYVLMIACTGEATGKKEVHPEMDSDMELKEHKVSKEISLFTVSNGQGMSVSVTNYGGIIQSLVVPDKDGVPGDIVLGFDSIMRYKGDHPYFGAIVGRYANRIDKGKFRIGDTLYQLTLNNGPNHLHGGTNGLDRVVWDARPIKGADSAGVELSYSSPDGDQGYPGRLDITVTYLLNNKNELIMDYRATTTRPTPVNITNHSYFNLTGDPREDILGHHIMINADKYTVVDDELIPTGELRDVAGTPFDLRDPVAIGSRINGVAGGYDHNFVLSEVNGMRKVVEVTEPSSGRVMEVFTTEPGIQFYTGNFLDGALRGKDNIVYEQHAGFCLETQHFPDSPNQPEFPGVILRPGEVYEHTTIYKFTVRD